MHKRRQELQDEFGESDDPLGEFDEEYSLDDVDETTLRLLIEMQLESNPSLDQSTQTMPTGVKLIVVGKYIFVKEVVDGVVEITNWATAEDFLNDIRFAGSFDRFFGDMEEKFNDDFWQYPVTLYHGTRDIEGVMDEGIYASNVTRGIGNRGVSAAVFTSLDMYVAQEYEDDIEGGIVAIDTMAMKQNGYTPYVSQEPEVLEEDLSSALMSAVGAEYEVEYADPGISTDTVIIYGNVPAKYLQVIDLG